VTGLVIFWLLVTAYMDAMDARVIDRLTGPLE
jgi:hypothetical protein